MTDKETIGVQEMAQRLGVTPQTIYNYLERGIIPGQRVRRGLRTRFVVLRADFDAAYTRLMSAGGDTIDDNIRTPMPAAA